MNKFFHGAAFYPELWPDEVVAADIAEMKRVGINVARIGEFAWAKMEPHAGEIDLGYFVAVMDQVHAAGIATVFCTPSATPPVWLTHAHPERCFVDESGRTMSHGARQHVCTSHPEIRAATGRIVEAIARAVGDHPGLVAWQIDNEFKCHVAECHCANCRERWHAWLERRYRSIDGLNTAWGTEIWSHRYERFEQVPTPVKTTFHHHASLQTAYRRFSQEEIAEFQREQVEIIRRHSRAPITHNSQARFRVDNAALFRDLDFASFDHYPPAACYREMIFHYDLFRTLKPGRAFWVMECSPSHNGNLGDVRQPVHPDGFVAAEAVAAFALGAEGFSYWLWRQQRTGCELPHGSVVSAWGKPTLGHAALLQVSRALEALRPMLETSRVRPAEVALTYSELARTMWVTEPLASGRDTVNPVNYIEQMFDWHERVRRAGFARDLAPEDAPLDGYKLLLTPLVPHLAEDYLARVVAWVTRGGTWIVGPMTHWRTAEHTVPTDAALGALEAHAGVEVVQLYPLYETGAVGEAFGVRAPLGLWGALMESRGAEVIGRTVAGRTPGLAFLTEHVVGAGRIVVLGAMPTGEAGDQMLTAAIRHYAQHAGVTAPIAASPDVIVAERVLEGGTLWIAVNFGAEPGSVVLPRAGCDAVIGESLAAGELQIAPWHWRAMRLAPT